MQRLRDGHLALRSLPVVLATALWSAGGCSSSPSGGERVGVGGPCTSHDSCLAGLVCAESICQQVCTTQGDCPAGMVCLTQLCKTPVGDVLPTITQIVGNAGDPGNELLVDNGMIVYGTLLANATFELQPAAGTGIVLDPLGASDTQVELLFPADIRAGSYTLVATNQAGSAQASVVLQLPDINGASVVARLNDGSATSPISVAVLPLGTTASHVAAGDHLHDTAYLPLTGGTLTGALGGTDATFAGDLAVAGNVTVGDSGVDTCTQAESGAVRWRGGSLEICGASHWSTLHTAGPNDGSSAADAPLSCNVIHTSYPALGDGVYWIDTDGAGTAAPFQVYCDMSTDGGGWTLCLNSRYTAAADFLFTGIYMKIPVGSDGPAGYYDFCGQNESEYLFTLADHAFGGYRHHSATVKFANPTASTASAEFSHVGITSDVADVTFLNAHASLNTACTGTLTLMFWEYINPASRGLMGFKRGHLQCDPVAGNPGVKLVMGAGCNYGACTSPPAWEADLYPTYSAWTWRVTASVGNGNNSWTNGYPITADRALIYYR